MKKLWETLRALCAGMATRPAVMARQVPKLASNVVCWAGVLCTSVLHALPWLREASVA